MSINITAFYQLAWTFFTLHWMTSNSPTLTFNRQWHTERRSPRKKPKVCVNNFLSPSDGVERDFFQCRAVETGWQSPRNRFPFFSCHSFIQFIIKTIIALNHRITVSSSVSWSEDQISNRCSRAWANTSVDAWSFGMWRRIPTKLLRACGVR